MSPFLLQIHIPAILIYNKLVKLSTYYAYKTSKSDPPRMA